MTPTMCGAIQWETTSGQPVICDLDLGHTGPHMANARVLWYDTSKPTA